MPHFYNAGGELVNPGTPGAFVSPTTILSIRHNTGLQAWRDRVGAEEADRRSKESTDRGTAAHNAIEAFLKGEASDAPAGFLTWFKKYEPETVAVEAFCRSSLHEFAGKVDYICRIDGTLWIIDWKTSKHIHQGYELQLAAYREAWQEMKGERARTKVVQLTDELKRGYREKEMDGDFGVFMAHKEVYEYAVSIGEIKHTVVWDGGLIY